MILSVALRDSPPPETRPHPPAFLILVSCLVGVLGTGCNIATYGKELGGVEPFKPRDPATVVFVEKGSIEWTREGKQRVDPSTGQSEWPYRATEIAEEWKRLGLIREWMPQLGLEATPTHRLRAVGTVDYRQSFGHVLLFAVTVGLVPVAVKTTVHLDVTLQRLDQGEVAREYSVSATNSWTEWARNGPIGAYLS
jgi:hypothetical protein